MLLFPEKEQEEVEATEEGEGELSEEEEDDDDDSKSQDKIEGVLGGQRTTTAAAPVGPGSSGSSSGSAEAAEPSDVSAGQAPPAGADPAGSAQTETNGSDRVNSASNGNIQKLLNGGGGGADRQTGVLGSFWGGVSHLDYTGIIEPSSHDFLLDQMVISSAVTAVPSADQSSSSSLDSPTGTDSTPTVSSSSSHSEAQREQTDGADSNETNGNGRQTLLMDTNTVTDQLVFLQTHALQTEFTGGAELVTGRHITLTASGVGLGHDITESSPVVLQTESADSFKTTLNSVSGVYSHTDLVTMATDLTGTASANPTGGPLDSSHPAVTDHTQTAGSVTEQYNPSGQGPEGAENVELEDTC